MVDFKVFFPLAIFTPLVTAAIIVGSSGEVVIFDLPTEEEKRNGPNYLIEEIKQEKKQRKNLPYEAISETDPIYLMKMHVLEKNKDEDIELSKHLVVSLDNVEDINYVLFDSYIVDQVEFERWSSNKDDVNLYFLINLQTNKIQDTTIKIKNLISFEYLLEMESRIFKVGKFIEKETQNTKEVFLKVLKQNGSIVFNFLSQKNSTQEDIEKFHDWKFTLNTIDIRFTDRIKSSKRTKKESVFRKFLKKESNYNNFFASEKLGENWKFGGVVNQIPEAKPDDIYLLENNSNIFSKASSEAVSNEVNQENFSSIFSGTAGKLTTSREKRILCENVKTSRTSKKFTFAISKNGWENNLINHDLYGQFKFPENTNKNLDVEFKFNVPLRLYLKKADFEISESINISDTIALKDFLTKQTFSRKIKTLYISELLNDSNIKVQNQVKVEFFLHAKMNNEKHIFIDIETKFVNTGSADNDQDIYFALELKKSISAAGYYFLTDTEHMLPLQQRYENFYWKQTFDLEGEDRLPQKLENISIKSELDTDFESTKKSSSSWFSANNFVNVFKPKTTKKKKITFNKFENQEVIFNIAGLNELDSYLVFKSKHKFDTKQTIYTNKKYSTSHSNVIANDYKFESLEKDKTIEEIRQLNFSDTVSIKLSEISSDQSNKTVIPYRLVVNLKSAKTFDSAKTGIEALINFAKTATNNSNWSNSSYSSLNTNQDALCFAFLEIHVHKTEDTSKNTVDIEFSTNLWGASYAYADRSNGQNDNIHGAEGAVGFEITKIVIEKPITSEE